LIKKNKHQIAQKNKSQLLYKKLQKQYSRKINLDLKRINLALKKLGNIHRFIENPINIIGSDGKYSTLKSLQYFIQENKEKVSIFTSPHLYDVRHRFWLKDKFISVKELKRNIKTIERLKVKLTLFELISLIFYISASKLKNISYTLVESLAYRSPASTRV
jgi:dihydrofolate synthase/folylpolyglutamate synthase